MAANIQELREILLKNGYTQEQVDKLKKKELRELVETMEAGEKLMESTVEIITEEKPKIDEKKQPSITDPNWTDYVLSLFDAKELENGMPRVDALRRVAMKLLGPFSSFTLIPQTPNIENAGRATVVVEIRTKDGICVCGAADVYSGNTAKEFACHSVATAETRAEGRALRKLLALSKILAAEELQNSDSDEPKGADNRMPSGMLNGLKIMCDRLGIDLQKIAVWMGYDISVVEDLTDGNGLKISNKLAELSRDKTQIPDQIKV